MAADCSLLGSTAQKLLVPYKDLQEAPIIPFVRTSNPLLCNQNYGNKKYLFIFSTPDFLV